MAEESPTKIIVSGTNGELLHEDPASKIEKISTDVKTEGSDVNSNEANGSPSETPVDPEPVSKPKLTPEEYLEKHKINILFEELIYRTLDSAPENPLKFLLSNLETMEKDNWVPGESQEEKTNAVTKIFKLPEAKKPDPPKGVTAGARTGTGTGRSTTPKVGTGTARSGARAVTTTRPAPASKTVSSPPKTTTSRVTATTKPIVKTTATPVKPTTTGTTRTTGTSTARATTAPVKPAATSPGTGTRTTTGAAKTGTTSTTRPTTTGATKPTTVQPRRPTATASATNKTGSNTSISKTGPSKVTSTPRSTGRGTTVNKTTAGAGARISTSKQPVRNSKTAAAPGKPTGGAGVKQEVAEPPTPEQEPVAPAEEPKVKSPEPAEPEPEPKPKTPEPDGQWSKIPGSDEPEAKPLDLEEQLAHDDVVHLSDDENIEIVEKANSDDQSNPSDEVLEVAEPVEKPPETVMTSQDYAADLQNIENEAEEANKGDKLEDMIDEGIEVREDFVRTSIPSIPPAMRQVLGAYKSVKENDAETTPVDVQNTVEVVVDDSGGPIDTQTPIESQGNIVVVVENPTEVPIDTQEEPHTESQGTVDIVVEDGKDNDLVEQPVATSKPAEEDPLLQMDDPNTFVNDQSPPLVPQEETVEVQQKDLFPDNAELVNQPPEQIEERKVSPEIFVQLTQEYEPIPIIQEKQSIEISYQEAIAPDFQYDESKLVHPKPEVIAEDISLVNPVMDPVDPPTPEENPLIDTKEPLTQTQVVPSPDPQEEPVQIEPIFPPASTGDDN